MPRFLMGGDLADIDTLCDIFNGLRGKKALDKKALLSNRTIAYISAMQFETAKLDLFKLDGSIDVVDIIRASIAMPLFYRRKVFINGIRYVDGAIGHGLPDIDFIKKEFDPTDILILTNRNAESLTRQGAIIEQIAERFAYEMIPEPVQSALKEDRDRKAKSLNDIRGSGIRYVIVWNQDLSPYEMRRRKLKKHADIAYKHFISVLKQNR